MAQLLGCSSVISHTCSLGFLRSVFLGSDLTRPFSLIVDSKGLYVDPNHPSDLEELLKNGYTNTSELYELENTALFRIMPEFNLLVEKYLKDARYEIIEQ